MEEIEDQLDSDEDDQAFLVTTNSGTGGNHIILAANNANANAATVDSSSIMKQTNELEQFGNLLPQHDQQLYHPQQDFDLVDYSNQQNQNQYYDQN